jgi:hypothetical protein
MATITQEDILEQSPNRIADLHETIMALPSLKGTSVRPAPTL